MRATIREPYPIYIGTDLLPSFNFNNLLASSFVIITDSTVDTLFTKLLTKNPTLRGHKAFKIVIPASETAKSLSQVDHVLRQLAKTAIDRDAVLLALGGGVVGDLTGFVASIYKRGVRYVQIPTTLLSQVDSSLGGKTGINLPEGKNLVGSTHNPTAVITDLTLLENLPQAELVGGFSELVKYGMIADKKLFTYIEKHFDNPTNKVYVHLVKTAARIKLSITRKDPREKEFRKILNYGHTIGHALENASNHTLSHGQAVGLGMIGEAYIANSLGVLSRKAIKRQNNLLRRFNLPAITTLNTDKLITVMRRDKKSKGGELYFVLPKSIGKVKEKRGQVAFPVDKSVVVEALNYLSDLSK